MDLSCWWWVEGGCTEIIMSALFLFFLNWNFEYRIKWAERSRACQNLSLHPGARSWKHPLEPMSSNSLLHFSILLHYTQEILVLKLCIAPMSHVLNFLVAARNSSFVISLLYCWDWELLRFMWQFNFSVRHFETGHGLINNWSHNIQS